MKRVPKEWCMKLLKSIQQWRFQQVRDASNLKHLSRKAAISESGTSSCRSMCATTRKTIRMHFPQPFGVHTMPLCAPDAGHRAIDLMFVLLSFDLAFVWFFSFPLFLPFGLRIFALSCCIFHFIFCKASQCRVCLESDTQALVLLRIAVTVGDFNGSWRWIK